jgi:hypothetical protein
VTDDLSSRLKSSPLALRDPELSLVTVGYREIKMTGDN